jgi:hypothetical protein
MGTVAGRGVKFRIYPKDHFPVHAHARIGAGEVIVEVRRDGSVALSTVHRDAVLGNVKDNEIARVQGSSQPRERDSRRVEGNAEMKDPRIATTAAEIRAAGKHARATAKALTVIVEAHYSKTQDAIVVRLNTGATFSVPRARLPGFGRIEPSALRKLEIEPPGNALWFDAPDIGVRLETLMIAAAGEGIVRSAAAQLLGSRTSSKKAASSVENGRLGGRPRRKVNAAA